MRWLAEELRRRRVPVQYPQLPAPAAPMPDQWRDVALAELEMLAEGDGERVVIAHSLGTVLWRHLEAAGTAPRVDRVLLVAPPGMTPPPPGLEAWAFAEQAAPAWRSPATMLAREVDPYRPEPLGQVADGWALPGIVLPGTGHLNPDDGHGPWEAVLDWALTGDARWRLGEGARSLDA